MRLLERLPERLFSLARPTVDLPEAVFDVILDNVVFGPLDSGALPTVQYEIARQAAAFNDRFVLAWRRAVADQLAMGQLTVVDGQVVGECPRAAGVDLDRLGEQFGVGRPRGMTDCCYWRLVLLLRFTVPTVRWKILELCELYTGVRPTITEAPSAVLLTWPGGGGASAFDDRTPDPDLGGWFFDVTGDRGFIWDAADSGIADDMHYGAWWDLDAMDPAGRDNTYWSGPAPSPGLGLTLHQAIEQCKALGVSVFTVNEPPAGVSGCYGARQRGGNPGGFVWA